MKKITSNPDIKSIYFWNLLGNVAASAVSVLYLMVVSRSLPANIADQFSLASSIGSLWIVVGLFQVRNFQGTDVMETYSLKDYFQTRIVTVCVMILTIFPYIFLVGGGNYTFELSSLIVIFLLYRSGDALSDVFQGYFQQINRLDIAGKLMFYRYTISVIVFAISIIISQSIHLSVISLVLFTILYVIFLEGSIIKKFTSFSWIKYFQAWNWKYIANILKSCFPLFINGYLLLSVLNEPKIVIERGLQLKLLETGIQRDFNILFMPVFFMSMCILVIRPQITNMAILWGKHEYAKFGFEFRRMVAFLLGIGVGAVVLAYFVGAPILSLIFGVDLSSYVLELTVLVLAGVLYSIAITIENVLTIFRRHSSLILTYIIIFALSYFIYQPFIFNMGILGAALSFLLVMIVYVFGALITFFIVYRQER